MKNVLIVDDDSQLRSMLALGLKRAGYNALEAGDGNEALQVLRGEHADLVVADMIMPEKDGVELMTEMRRSYPSIPIIAMSGGGRSSAGNYLNVAKQFGAVSTLAKPFTLDTLVAVVGTTLGEGVQ